MFDYRHVGLNCENVVFFHKKVGFNSNIWGKERDLRKSMGF